MSTCHRFGRLTTLIVLVGLFAAARSAAAAETVIALSPRGIAPPIERFALAERPPSFAGKRIALVTPQQNGSRMSEAFEIVEAALSERFADAKILRIPKESTYSSDDPAFWDHLLKEADVFVYGAAPSASSTDWAVNWTGLLEKRGLPGAVIHYEALSSRVERSRSSKGVPIRSIPMTYPPSAMDRSAKQAFSAAVVRALSEPLGAHEKQIGFVDRVDSNSKMAETLYASVDALIDDFHAQGWTDGLPFVPPTPERVARMLTGSSRSKDDVVTGSAWPESWSATVEHVAVNAVMAGAKPSYFPTLLALAELWGSSYNYSTVQSTNSFAYMVVVNGPVRHELDMNAGTYALGPGNRANATIGRALRLFITNLGGGQPGINMMGSQGNPAMYSLAFAEDEESSPWDSLAVEHGFTGNASTVAIMTGGWSKVGNFLDGDLDHLIRAITHWEYPGRLTVLMTPLAAQSFAREGYTKDSLKNYIAERARMSLGEFKDDTYYDWFVLPSLQGKRSLPGLNWPKEYLTLPDTQMVSVFPSPDAINLIVVGGDVNPMMQGWSFGALSFASVDKWR